MLDIVVYEDKKNFIRKNIDSIDLSIYNMDYCVHKYDSYTREFGLLVKNSYRRKIYILDDEVDVVSGLEVAEIIRKYDWDSIIILVVRNGKKIKNMYRERLMTLDIVYNENGDENRLIDDIKLAISIVIKQCAFTFKYNRAIYRIPYNQICYIEKEQSIKRCIIHTVNKQYYIVGTINSILAKLNDNFCRTHQSCIVNLDNICKIDLGSNMIIFNNGDSTDMLTDKMKREIKNYIGIYK